MKGKTIQILLPTLLLGVALSSLAEAQIYRCDLGDTTVFSDVPCAENAIAIELPSSISVVGAADDLDDIAELNRQFVDQRQTELAQRRARAQELAQQAEQNRRRRASIEAPRHRTIIGHAAGFGLNNRSVSRPDPRSQARREQARTDTESERRRTLLSRSGGNRSRIVR